MATPQKINNSKTSTTATLSSSSATSTSIPQASPSSSSSSSYSYSSCSFSSCSPPSTHYILNKTGEYFLHDPCTPCLAGEHLCSGPPMTSSGYDSDYGKPHIVPAVLPVLPEVVKDLSNAAMVDSVYKAAGTTYHS